MEFIDGCKINDLEGLKKIRANPTTVSTIFAELLSEQTFLHGWVHSDPQLIY